MGKLYFYAVFHANLSFSSIPSDQYPVILDRCYWPVLDLVSRGYKLGLELSSSTLMAINKLDRYFIEELTSLWNKEKCEVIGSSYIQSIFPLIPVEVNRVNLIEGKNDYIKLLGRLPQIGYVNEQTYSKGLPELYSDIGYKAIIMDWDNAAEFNDISPDLRYRPAFVKGINDIKMPILWNSSLNSYKFQRCIYNRLSPEDFISSSLVHKSNDTDRALPLYGTDWEIFDYRPGTQEIASGEICKIEKVLKKLISYSDVELVNPGEVLTLIPPEDVVSIESSQCPLPCKNRDDYNVLRWAVSGRDNVYMNTECFRIYNKLKYLDFFTAFSEDNSLLWRELNDLWSSDLRTKTTDEKYYAGRLKIGEVSRFLDKKIEEIYDHFNPRHDFMLINQFPHDWNYEPYEIDISFNPGEKTGDLFVEIDGQLVLSQCEHVEFYRDGSYRRVKLIICPFIKSGQIVEGKIICFSRSKHQKMRKYCGDKLKIETESVKLSLASSTGADIRELIFPQIDKNPLIGYLPPVYYDHIGHSSDYYSGGIQVCDSFGRTYNDTIATSLHIPENIDDYHIRIPVTCEINFGIGICWKRFYIYRDFPRLDMSYRFYFSDLSPIYFRVGIITLNPEAFNKNQLRFTTVNGSDYAEEFFTCGKTIQHNAPVGSLSSARTCIGASEGWVDISDKSKNITIATNKSILYSVPMIEYEEVKKSYLMRLYHTISESNDTGRVHWRGNNKINFSFYGHKNELSAVRTMVEHSSRDLIYIPKKLKEGQRLLVNKERFISAFEKADCVV